MLYLLFNVFIYALVVIFALLLTPGIHVGEQRGVIEWFIVGAAYGLLNAIIRPLIVMFTGRLLIRSLGTLTWPTLERVAAVLRDGVVEPATAARARPRR